jgi:hypothetical protein
MSALRIGAPRPAFSSIDLRELGFIGYVSQVVREQIRADELRAQRVISTAHRFLFRRAFQPPVTK